MKLKRNKGSSMLLVVVFVGILVTLVLALISIIGTNYMAKAKEGERIKNLYNAESGLDVAYNIIVKDFEAGVQAGNASVKDKEEYIQTIINKKELSIEEQEYKKSITDENNEISQDKINDEKNKAFKQGFENYIGNSEDNVFKKYIPDWQYVVYGEENPVQLSIKKGNKPSVKCENTKLEKHKYIIPLSSTFSTSQEDSSIGEHKRKVEVTYFVDVPDYDKIYNSEISDDPDGDSPTTTDPSAEIDAKVIMVDGNMTVNGKNSQAFTIDGDVFVKGNNTSDLTQDIVYNKYKGGIQITGSNANVTFNGNVVTKETFNVNSNNSTVTINKKDENDKKCNLYCGNVYIGNTDGTESGASNITLNNVITDNDFAVKSNGSNINVNNFYGINDKNLKGYNSNTKNEEKTSSSIIVNNDKNSSSSLNIKGEAYIMGTAFLNVQNKSDKYYQTGESVCIKGNYIAYTKPLDDAKYEFNKYGLLQMVDKKNNENLDVLGKSEYFKDFVEKSAKEGEITDGGVKLQNDKTYAAGALVYKEDNTLKVERANYTKNTGDAVDVKQGDYAKEVCMMGNLGNENAQKVYNNQSSYQKTVSNNIINFTKISENKIPAKAEGELFILNKNSDKTIIISNKDISVGENEQLVKVEGDEINALIISKGKIKLDGNFTINGAIIGGSDLDISNRTNANINYSKDVINQIINHNIKSVKIFRKYTNINANTPQSGDDESGNQTSEIDTIKDVSILDYDVREYIHSENWKISESGDDNGD